MKGILAEFQMTRAKFQWMAGQGRTTGLIGLGLIHPDGTRVTFVHVHYVTYMLLIPSMRTQTSHFDKECIYSVSVYK